MRQTYSSPRQGRSRLRGRLILLLLIVFVPLLALAVMRVGADPEIEIDTSVPGIGRSTDLRVAAREPGRGVGGLRMELVQEEQVFPLGEATGTTRPFWAFWGERDPELVLEAVAGRDELEGLKEGVATLRVTADRAGTWLRRPGPVVVERELPVRFRPPSVQSLSDLVYVNQGGSEVVVYRVGPAAVRHGVRAGEAWFPGSPLPDGGDDEFFALFAWPFDLEDENEVRLVAADDLGNEATVAFVDRFFPKRFPRSTIRLSDGFLEKVVPAIVERTPEIDEGATLLETYLTINRDLRARNTARLVELGTETAEQFYWNRPFLQQPNTQVMDQFAAYRTYTYQDEEVDQQVHLGFDLASVKRDRVVASNRGEVLMAEYFGIYGNAVVLDHGYGLQSVYAHLSSIDIEVGQTVERGDVVGRSGETGLAGGDHLHLTVMVRGVQVNPAEWFDEKWIRDHIVAKLGEEVLRLES